MYKILRPFIFLLDPEFAHNLLIKTLKLSLSQKIIKLLCAPTQFNQPKKIMGLTFPNIVGLAAGFDKNAEIIQALANIGFGFIEIGTVTPLPQQGNPKPRIFRLPKDKAIINRMGFNNIGVQRLIENIKQIKNKKIILGINIGKNKNTPNHLAYTDYKTAFKKLFDYGDYFVVNVSSPNTPNLRKLQEIENLRTILNTLQEINKQKNTPKPILVKIAPDLSLKQIDQILQVVSDTKINGIVATNTTISRSGLKTKSPKTQQPGGLSGKPLQHISTKIIRYIRTQAPDITIIGVGGIFTPNDALEKLDAGADLIQIYTGLIYEGPTIVKRIKKSIYFLEKKT